jgi:uncharacterized protein
MSTLNDIMNVLSNEKPLFQKMGIIRVGIFGSFVKGTSKEDSDIDILIELDSDSPLSLFSLIDLEQKLSDKFNRKADICISRDIKPYLREKIFSEVRYV